MANLTSQLYESWQKAVFNDKIINQFTAPQDDPLGRWYQTDQIVYGIRWIDGKLAYYARNLSQSKDIPDTSAQKQLDPPGYQCQFNSYRSLRPGGSGRPLGRQPDISATLEDCRFHCQDRTQPLSLLCRQPLLQVKLSHFVWNAYYNAAPLEKEGHFLWVPTLPEAIILPHMPQQLSSELLTDAVELFSQLDKTILFFNALHAGASVNHIHLQTISQQQPLPVEGSSTFPYQGYDLLDNYPIQSIVFTTQTPTHKIFTCVDRLQHAGIPFNLAMLGERLLITLRDANHEIVSEFPSDGFAALEMCGAIYTANRQTYDAINTTILETAFQKMVIPAQQIIDTWLIP